MAGQEQENVVPFAQIVPFKKPLVGDVSESEENNDEASCMKRDNVPLVYINNLKPRRGDEGMAGMVITGAPVVGFSSGRQVFEATRGHIQTAVVELPWVAKIDGMTDRQLKAEFRSEFECYDAMKRRRYTHGAVIHDAFRTFRGFLAYMGSKPFPTATVDRRDTSDPEYSPWKVRWADKATQTENRKNTVWIKAGPKKLSAASVAKKQHVSASAIRKRKLRGWTAEEILAGSRRKRASGAASPVGCAINFTKDEAPMKSKIKNAQDVVAAFKPKIADNEPLSKIWVKTLARSSGWFVPPLTIKDAGLLNRAVSQMPPGHAADVIKYAILHWAEFTAAVEDFAGRVKTPSMPQVPFFCQFAMIASNLWLANNQPVTAAYPEPDEDEPKAEEPAISAKELEELEDEE